MSAVPNAQLEGLLAGGQLLGQAQENQATTFQAEAQRRAAGLEARGQDLQNMMQQRELNAQAQNYRRLNEREMEMQRRQLAQQESQFSRAQAQDREMQIMDKEFTIAIAQAQAKAKQKAAEILAGQKDDATLKALRGERAAAQDQARRLEQALNAARSARDLARQTKEVRLEDIEARINAFHQSVSLLNTQTREAMGNAISDAILQNTRESGGFLDEAGRNDGFWKTLGQNIADATFSTARPIEDVESRMTAMERSPTTFAASVINAAFTRYDDALGIRPEQKAAAEQIFMSMITKAAVLGQVDDPLLAAPSAPDSRMVELFREDIARKMGELRATGMQDAQILAMLQSLEGMAERSSTLVTEQGLGATGIEGAKGEVLQKTLTGIGSIIDGIEAVTSDVELMRKNAGGELVDYSKFDMPRVYRMANQAYALDRASPQMEAFTGEIGRLGIRDPKQVEELVGVLIENDPQLRDLGFKLDPKEVANMVLQLEQETSKLGQRSQGLAEEEALAVQQYAGRGQQEAAQFEVDAFNELMANLRSRNGG
jgi:hypothetical protein